MSSVKPYIPSLPEECVILRDALTHPSLDAQNRGWFYASGGQIALALLNYRGLLQKNAQITYELTERGRQVAALDEIRQRSEDFLIANPHLSVCLPFTSASA